MTADITSLLINDEGQPVRRRGRGGGRGVKGKGKGKRGKGKERGKLFPIESFLFVF